MTNDFASIGIGYSWEKVLENCIGLGVNFFLRLGYGLWFAWKMRLRNLVRLPICHELRASPFHDGLAKMVADTIHVVVKVIRILGALE